MEITCMAVRKRHPMEGSSRNNTPHGTCFLTEIAVDCDLRNNHPMEPDKSNKEMSLHTRSLFARLSVIT